MAPGIVAPADEPQFYGGALTGHAEEAPNGAEKAPTPYKYAHYLPCWEKVNTDTYQPFEHVEHGNDADPALPNLLADATVTDITGYIGTEVRGVQLSKLSCAARDELALFAAQRRVLVFRDQDYADLPLREAVDWAEYYGPSQVPPTAGAVKDFPEIDIIHRNVDAGVGEQFFRLRTSGTEWHSDSTYELQPPGTTVMYILEGPKTGSDTVFCDMVSAYQRLSPAMQKRLHGLKAIHSNVEQAVQARRRKQNSIVRREPIETEHPIVRTHPVTGEKALFINPGFTTRIVDLKKEESAMLLKFLYDHVAFSQDLHVRVKWEKGSVLVWDNRLTTHTVVMDVRDAHRRHLARITPMAERPYETPFVET